MIKAILFDCFGVLAASSLEPFYDKYLAGDVLKITQATTLDRQSSRGEITYDSFVIELAKIAQIPTPEAADFLDNNPPNEKLLQFIRDELHNRFKIGLLSNASDNWLDELFSAEQLALFDDFVLSFEHGHAKPEKDIYMIAASRLNVAPEECLFIDDVQTYCDGAADVGMASIRYTNFENFRTLINNYVP